MIIFENKNEYKSLEMNQSGKTVSTLLVPKHLAQGFLKKRNELYGKNTAAYFRYLLSICKIFTHSGMLPKPKKIKTEYQEENLNLQRLSFRPSNSDWIELGALAIAFGKSRCWLFTYLLELDLVGFWDILSEFFKSVSDPTNERLEVKGYWTLKRFFHNFTRGYHVKV